MSSIFKNGGAKKSIKYRTLVREMQDKYKGSFAEGDDVKLIAPYIKDKDGKLTCFCNEINLYTYWQGLNYAYNVPEIKYLLVGQDWGNPFSEDNAAFMENIEKINVTGDEDIPYIDKNLPIRQVDKNLIEFFKELGYDDITRRYDDLFFTNFCLGYRNENVSNVAITKPVMMEDAELFKKLCDILEPEKILCLGRKTFKCVYMALTGKKFNINGSYEKFVNEHKDIIVQCGDINSKIYPLFECDSENTINEQRKVWAKIEDYERQKRILDKLTYLMFEEGLYWDEESVLGGRQQTVLIGDGQEDELRELLGCNILYFRDEEYDMIYHIEYDDGTYEYIDGGCGKLLEKIGINTKFMVRKILKELENEPLDENIWTIDNRLTLLMGNDEKDSPYKSYIYVSKKDGDLVILEESGKLSEDDIRRTEDSDVMNREEFLERYF